MYDLSSLQMHVCLEGLDEHVFFTQRSVVYVMIQLSTWARSSVCFCTVTQQNSHSINYLHSTGITLWLHSDSAVIIGNCWQHGDYTVDQLCSHHVSGSCQRWLKCHCEVTVLHRWLMELEFCCEVVYFFFFNYHSSFGVRLLENTIDFTLTMIQIWRQYIHLFHSYFSLGVRLPENTRIVRLGAHVV